MGMKRFRKVVSFFRGEAEKQERQGTFEQGRCQSTGLWGNDVYDPRSSEGPPGRSGRYRDHVSEDCWMTLKVMLPAIECFLLIKLIYIRGIERSVNYGYPDYGGYRIATGF